MEHFGEPGNDKFQEFCKLSIAFHRAVREKTQFAAKKQRLRDPLLLLPLVGLGIHRALDKLANGLAKLLVPSLEQKMGPVFAPGGGHDGAFASLALMIARGEGS
jgi:hypothetical protein